MYFFVIKKGEKMKSNFFNLKATEQTALIKQCASKMDLSEMIIQKDLWVCWLLEKAFALPVQMAFKGGTSLSKVFGLIKRFSEDCDITIDYRNFKPELNLEHSSRTQLKSQLNKYISHIIFPYLQEETLKSFPNEKFEIKLSEDGEKLHFFYPSIISGSHGYLRDHVLLEFGVRNCTVPCEKHLVKTYLAQTCNFDFPTPMIDTLSPVRTFWEKATLIHVECHRDRLINTPGRLSRHWYDLFMLGNSWVGEKALSGNEILKSVIEHKKAFFNSAYANYDDCLSGKFRLIPETLYLETLKRDFLKMIDAGMFHETPPQFDTIIESLRALEVAIQLS
jgi:hypothetical protein